MKTFQPRKTCSPSPEFSLFKYILNYMPGAQDGTKEISRLLFSFDYGSEREKFMPAPNPILKIKYVGFIDQLSQEANQGIVDFFANCYPMLTSEKKVVLLYSHDLEMQELHKYIQSHKDIVAEISRIAREVGFTWSGVQMQKFGEKVSASMTPKFHPNREKFNGMTKCIDTLIKNYSSQGLMSIEIYDNRMLRSDNLISKVAVNNFMTSQVEDHNPPKSISQIINGRAS